MKNPSPQIRILREATVRHNYETSQPKIGQCELESRPCKGQLISEFSKCALRNWFNPLCSMPISTQRAHEKSNEGMKGLEISTDFIHEPLKLNAVL